MAVAVRMRGSSVGVDASGGGDGGGGRDGR